MKALVCLCLLSSVAAAAPIAILPGEGKLSVVVDNALVDAAKKLDGYTLANLENGKLRGPRTEPKGEARLHQRAQLLAREQSAQLVVTAEPEPIGDGAVVYLQVIEASGKTRGSTTVVLGKDVLAQVSALERALRGGLVQILDSAKFVGRLELRVDVKGAKTEVDGRVTQAATNGLITLPVGPHAVRVTHPAYHDWLRFVDIAYDQTRVEPVALAAFPLTEGEMAEKRKHGGPVVMRKLPWYRTWWALTLTGVVVCGATIGIVLGAREGLRYDHEAHYTGVPTP